MDYDRYNYNPCHYTEYRKPVVSPVTLNRVSLAQLTTVLKAMDTAGMHFTGTVVINDRTVAITYDNDKRMHALVI